MRSLRLRALAADFTGRIRQISFGSSSTFTNAAGAVYDDTELSTSFVANDVSANDAIGDGRDALVNAWWISVFPGIIIFTATLCISIVGDWLRDRLDPMLRSRAA